MGRLASAIRHLADCARNKDHIIKSALRFTVQILGLHAHARRAADRLRQCVRLKSWTVWRLSGRVVFQSLCVAAVLIPSSPLTTNVDHLDDA